MGILDDFKKAFDPKKNGAADAFDPSKNGAADAFNPSKNGAADAFSAKTWDPKKNGFDASVNSTMVKAANGSPSGDVVGSTSGETPDLLSAGKSAFDPKRTGEQFKKAFADFGNDVVDGANSLGDAVGGLYGDAKDAAGDAASAGADMMQKLMLIGGGLLILYVILDD